MSDKQEHGPESMPDEDAIAFGVHVIMLKDGHFGLTATGQPNLGELQMLLSRALASVEARMTAETVVATLAEIDKSKRVITLAK